MEKNSVEPAAGRLAGKLSQVSASPGVYLMKNASGGILYAGKAKNLRKRLQSYFQPGRPQDPKTTVLLTKVADFETIITQTEKEALILESNLIKRHRPRYNVNLKDDKRYPCLRLNMTHAFPNLNITRKIKNDGALYFGPYTCSAAVRQTLKFIQKTFKLRKCHSKTFMNRSRPCLNYQMGLCLGPCVYSIDPEQYTEIVKEVIAFLKGRTPELIRKIKQEMLFAAKRQEFEAAAKLRDKLFSLEKTLEKQITVSSDFKDRDIFSMVSEQMVVVGTLLKVRRGFLLGSRHFHFQDIMGSADEQMRLLIRQYYEEIAFAPSEILVDHLPADLDFLENHLSEKSRKKISILAPRRGEKKRLVQMAVQNAHKELKDRLIAVKNQSGLLERLQKKLKMPIAPDRIECFDNSNLFGSNPVSAMVVFDQGKPSKNDYRRYKINAKAKPDDYADMAEVLRRRYGKGPDSDSFPDLLIVDGGRGQISVAESVLAQLGLTGRFSVAGIAKKDVEKGETQDKIYLPGRANEIQFGRETDLLLFLQSIRDEAHRWAVSFHRQRRTKTALISKLDDIAGVGPKRKAQLLKHFGSFKKLQAASREELQSVAGISKQLSDIIKTHLNKC
ncbi:MAG: excinuclease ABC subunit UvrC [Desulfobacteraceae bacterium]|nr:excinuclease ABC subunit UvrC [Desulfobacteraceae bacterium]